MNSCTRILCIILAWVGSAFTLFAQHTLTIEINGFRNNEGQVLLELGNEQGEKIGGYTAMITNRLCIFIIPNLTQGSYTFRYFHDENKNKRLDTNFMGIPKEGFGFANNATVRMGPPSVSKTKITVNQHTQCKCKPTYFF